MVLQSDLIIILNNLHPRPTSSVWNRGLLAASDGGEEVDVGAVKPVPMVSVEGCLAGGCEV